MKKLMNILTVSLLAALVTSGTVQTQTELVETSITAAAEAQLPAATSLYGVNVRSLNVGGGLSVWSDGFASGQLQTELVGMTVLGVPQSIHVEGEVSTGSVAPGGNPNFSGLAQVDLGTGAPPLIDVPFTVALAADGN